MTATPSAPGALNWLLILFLGVIWGAAFMGTTIALESVGPWWVAAGRVALGGGALIVLGMMVGQPVWTLPSRRALAYATVIGVGTIALPFALLSWGLTQVPSAFAGVAMGAVPLLVLPLVAIFSPEEGIGPRRVMGVILGFLGLLVLIGPGAASDGTMLARLGVAGAALCYAVGSVVTRRAPPMPPVAFATVSLMAAAAILVPLALALEGVPQSATPRSIWALVYIALFPTALAAIIRVRVITTAGSLFMSLTSYMVPVWAVIFGVALLGEDLPPQLFGALALILAGIGLSQLHVLRR